MSRVRGHPFASMSTTPPTGSKIELLKSVGPSSIAMSALPVSGGRYFMVPDGHGGQRADQVPDLMRPMTRTLSRRDPKTGSGAAYSAGPIAFASNYAVLP
jgi:hypothetical protein